MNEVAVGSVKCDVFNGQARVGVLTQATDGTALFAYDADYKGPELLSLPNTGAPIESKGLHPFFRNLVSEGWLEEAHKKVLNSYNRHISPFNILACFGEDCIGSFRIVPQESLPNDVVFALVDVDSKLAHRNGALIPGVQPKFLATKLPSGDFAVATREIRSTHIAKLVPPLSIDDLALDRQNLGGMVFHEPNYSDIIRNEFVTTEVVRALLPKDETARVEMMPLRGIAGEVLLVERFDRDANGTPIELYEFCQLLGKGPEQKYDSSYKAIADYIRLHASGAGKDGIKTNLQDIDVLFKRLLAMILVENGDTHLKNFALIRKGDEYRLSPNYDLVSCARYKGDDQMALAIWGVKNLDIGLLKPKHIVMLAQDLGLLSAVPTPDEIARLNATIEEMGERVKGICTSVDKGNGDLISQIELIRKQPALWRELKTTTDCMKRRWNGTLAGVPLQLNKMSQENRRNAERQAAVRAKAETLRPSPTEALKTPGF